MKLHIEDYDGESVCRCGSLNLTTDPAKCTCRNCKSMWDALKKTGYARASEHPEDYKLKPLQVTAGTVLKVEDQFYAEIDRRLETKHE